LGGEWIELLVSHVFVLMLLNFCGFSCINVIICTINVSSRYEMKVF
jgi:hypothetical protein